MAKSTRSAIGDIGWHKSIADRGITLGPLTVPDEPLPPEDAMDLDGDTAPAPAPSPPLHVLLPEREQQTTDALRPPAERAAFDRMRRGGPALAREEPLLQYMTTQLLPSMAARSLGVTVMGPSGLPSGGGGGAAAGAGATGTGTDGSTPPPTATGGGGKRRRHHNKRGAAATKTAALLGTFGGDGAQDRMVFGEPVPIDVRLVMLSDALQRGSALTAAAIAESGGGGERSSGKRTAASTTPSSTTAMRLSTPVTGHVGGYNRWTAIPPHAQFEVLFKRYFAKDRFPASAGQLPARGLDPATFGPMRALVERHVSFSNRRAMMEEGTGAVPLRADLPPLNREYFTVFRLPVAAKDIASGAVRLCREGNHCVVNREGPPEKCYVMREFLLPHEAGLSPAALREAKPQAGHCIDCLLVTWTTATARNVQLKRPVQRPMNTFTVLVRAGEYGAHHLLQRNTEGLSTGIEGFVPAYSRNRREYVPIPREYAMAHGLGGPGAPAYYYAEIDVDFRLTSDTPTSR